MNLNIMTVGSGEKKNTEFRSDLKEKTDEFFYLKKSSYLQPPLKMVRRNDSIIQLQ